MKDIKEFKEYLSRKGIAGVEVSEFEGFPRQEIDLQESYRRIIESTPERLCL
jgi:nitrogen regulatory protein PII